jgi:hypothetical protein
MDCDIDELLRRNAERQLEDFDWDRQRQVVMQRLAAPPARRQVVVGIRVVAAAAAVLMLIAGYVLVSLLTGTGREATAPIETRVAGSIEGDPLLASTDATTILLTGSARLLTLNDPMLKPHSLWDQ